MTPEQALLAWLQRAYEMGLLTERLSVHIASGRISLSEAVSVLERVLTEAGQIEASLEEGITPMKGQVIPRTGKDLGLKYYGD